MRRHFQSWQAVPSGLIAKHTSVLQEKTTVAVVSSGIVEILDMTLGRNGPSFGLLLDPDYHKARNMLMFLVTTSTQPGIYDPYTDDERMKLRKM
jgi:hypothetical protein